MKLMLFYILVFTSLIGCENSDTKRLSDYSGERVLDLVVVSTEPLSLNLFFTEHNLGTIDCYSYDAKASINGKHISLSEVGGIKKDFDNGGEYCEPPHFHFGIDDIDWEQDTLTIEIWDESLTMKAVYQLWNGELPWIEIVGSSNSELQLGSVVELMLHPAVDETTNISLEYAGVGAALSTSSGTLERTESGVSFLVHSNFDSLGSTELELNVEPYWTPPAELIECTEFDVCETFTPSSGSYIFAQERQLPYSAITSARHPVILVE